MSDWFLIPLDQYEKDYSTYEKKKPNELLAVLNNLDRYMATLGLVGHPKFVSAGFIHPEQKGVVSLDQKGRSKVKLQQTRLYLYPDVDNKRVFLLKIGNKNQQQADVTYCSQMVDAIRRSEGNGQSEKV